MARINDTTTFPNQTSPALDDHVIGTDVSDVSTSADGQTVTFRLGDIADLSSTFIESVDLSAAASFDFTGFDSSKYDGYKVMLQNVTLGNAYDLLLRVSTDGGSSYLSTGYINAGSSVTNGISLFEDYLPAGGSPNDGGVSGVIYINGPHLTKVTQVTGSTVGEVSGTGYIQKSVAGKYAANSAVNAFQIIASTSTLPTGTITVYGMRSS